MCHLMPQRHLPEWREEDERAFVHRGSWVSNKGLDNTLPAIVNLNCHSVQMPAHPPLPTLADAAVASSGTCHCSPVWHNFPVYTIEK